MSVSVFKALCCGGAMSLLACQSSTSTITPNNTAPVSIACDAKQTGGVFTACSSPIGQSAQHAAIGGDVHTGQRFAVNGSFEGVLR